MSPTQNGLVLAACLLALLSNAPASPPELRQFPAGQVVTSARLPEAICRGWVEVRTSSPAQLAFWDILLDVDADSRLLLGCNKDYIYALSLAGRFDNGLQRITPGRVSLWSHFGGSGDSPAIYDFSAAALLRLFSPSSEGNDPGLEVLAHTQEGDSGNLHLASSGALASAPAGQPFRAFPEIIAIKRASRHAADYGLRTASQFANALSQQDTGLLAALLAPSLFQEESSAISPPLKPSPTRLAFAERLLALNDYASVTTLKVRDLGNLQYEMHASQQAFRISLQEVEGCLYVKRLDPQS